MQKNRLIWYTHRAREELEMSKVNQNRNAPAYLEYAASMMSRLDYRRFNLEVRGLLYTLRLECWVNQSLPANTSDLARILGVPVDVITRLLPELIGPFFTEREGFLQCPEIEAYRLKVQDHRNKQSEGGKRARANDKLKRESAIEPTFIPVVSDLNLLNPKQINQNQEKEVSKMSGSHEEWVREYDEAIEPISRYSSP
jgi:hypothetical protein